jgi:hypothetical protein
MLVSERKLAREMLSKSSMKEDLTFGLTRILWKLQGRAIGAVSSRSKGWFKEIVIDVKVPVFYSTAGPAILAATCRLLVRVRQCSTVS